MSSKSNQKAITEWCSDQLHDLVGFADSALSRYLVHVASSARSSEDIKRVLLEGNVQASPEKLGGFCSALLRKCQPQRQKTSERKTASTNADWVKKAETYSLLDDQDLELDAFVPSKKESKKEKNRKTSKEADATDDSRRRRLKEAKRHRRKRDNSSGESSEEDAPHESDKRKLTSVQDRRENRRKRIKDENETKTALSATERAELEREKDLRERDEFVQRLLERDKTKTKDKTKKDAEPEESEDAYRKRIDLEQRLAKGEEVVGADGKVLTLERLRTESRRAYLKKRQEREVTLLKQSLQDEEELFRGAKLTEAERKRIALSKRILGMVEENDDEQGKEDGFYRLPDEYSSRDTKGSQDNALLTSRYVEPKLEKSEQELWEESQTKKAAAVARGNKKSSRDEKEYELVFDDQIDFVMQETNKGYDRRDKKKKGVEEESSRSEKDVKQEEDFKPLTEHEKILAGRKKLPVYPYREEFLAAVKDHQILVLVGETGSGKVSGSVAFYPTICLSNQSCLTQSLLGHFAQSTDNANSAISS